MLLGFDADDTLWHNETIFESAHARFAEILARWHPRDTVERALYATEMRNLPLYGYGVKGFALSVLETALELAGDELRPAEVREILALERGMLEHPVDLLEGVADTVPALAAAHPLALITKGDLNHQSSKIERSGLRRHFRRVEIVADKSPAVYRSLLEAWGVAPRDFVMVGNSLRSDVLPVLEIGGTAVWVPYPLTWEHEKADVPPRDCPRFHTLASIRDLPALLAAPQA